MIVRPNIYNSLLEQPMQGVTNDPKVTDELPIVSDKAQKAPLLLHI
jgi:hypothetical protein